MADRLDLRDLRYFEEIAAGGHVGRAAKALHRSQPALTGAVRRLEEKLGTPLFERAGRGIRLTSAGEALHERARALRIAAEDIEREVSEIGRGKAGLVRLGLVPTAARFLLPPLTRDFTKAAPGVRFRATIGNNDALWAALKSGDIDVAVTLPNPADEDVESHPIAEDDCVVVAWKDHPVLRSKHALRELPRYGWVLGRPGIATREWIEHAFREQGLAPPRVQVEINELTSMRNLLEGTELLSFMSRRHLAPGEGLREVKLRALTMRRVFSVCVRRGSYLSPVARRVVDTLKKRGAALFKRG
jgi:DNA-binding transcriptional LysR family regulator